MKGMLHIDEGVHGGSGPFLSPDYGEVNKAFLVNRGWTRHMIARFLGKPDRVRVRRGMGQRPDRPECLFAMQRVLDAEGEPEFRLWQQRLEVRRIRLDVKRATGMLPPSPKRKNVAGCEEGIPHGMLPAWRTLSRRDRRIVWLLFEWGWRQQAAAERLKLSQSTISRVRQRFLEAIRMQRHVTRKTISLAR